MSSLYPYRKSNYFLLCKERKTPTFAPVALKTVQNKNASTRERDHELQLKENEKLSNIAHIYNSLHCYLPIDIKLVLHVLIVDSLSR